MTIWCGSLALFRHAHGSMARSQASKAAWCRPQAPLGFANVDQLPWNLPQGRERNPLKYWSGRTPPLSCIK